MIRRPRTDGLTPRQVYGIDVLVDLSRLLVTESPDVPAVTVRTTRKNGSSPYTTLEQATAQIEATPDGVTVSRAILDLIADMAGTGIEQGTDAADRFGRVPSADNPLVAMGLERTPVVSELARVLAERVSAGAGDIPIRRVSPWPGGHRWAVAMTHDLDVVSMWPLLTALRLLELLKGGHPAMAVRAAGAALGSALGNPVLAAAAQVLAIESEFGVASSWFLIAGDPTPTTFARRDITYRLESRAARRIVEAAASQRCEMGLHGSFDTTSDARLLRSQASRIAAVTGGEVRGARQHFLRVRPPATHRAMAEAGFDYDASMGFADRNGFRLGVGNTVPCWDDREMVLRPLELVPLTWMDRALSKYGGVQDPDAWIDDGLELAKTCMANNGLWVGLWHPNLCTALGFPGALKAYHRLVSTLAEGDPLFAPLSEIVEWRKARRSLRVVGSSPDGLPVIASANDWAGGTVDIETAEGAHVARCEVSRR